MDLSDAQPIMQKTTPEVSIIIPAYNQARFLRQAIDSALAQSFQDIEIIVVDDGSTDDTAAIAASYGDKIHYLYQSNLGLAGARNTGIRAARGKFIGLLDADDVWMPEYLAKIISLANQHPTAALYYTRARCMDVDGNDLPQIVGGHKNSNIDIFSILLRSNFIIPSTVTMRRSAIVAAGYFDQTLRSCEDWDLWLRLLPDSQFIACPDVLVRYRVHQNSLSANVSGMHAAKRAVVEKNHGPDTGLIADWTPEKRQAYAGLYRYYLVTAVQRQGDYRQAITNLTKALKVEPALAYDLDLFYELALGNQPAGHRGVIPPENLAENSLQVIHLLDQVFEAQSGAEIKHLRRATYGTANYALGLIAYSAGDTQRCRRYLGLALRYRPDLWRDRVVTGNILKSFLGRKGLAQFRRKRSQNG